MSEPHNDNSNDTIESSLHEQEGTKSVWPKIAAAAVTFIILYMLLGIPAYLLFRVFFGE